MDYEAIVNLVSTLGFPIVMCIALIVSIKYVFDKMDARNEKQAEQQREEINTITELHRQETAEFVKSINEVTVIMNKILVIVGGEES